MPSHLELVMHAHTWLLLLLLLNYSIFYSLTANLFPTFYIYIFIYLFIWNCKVSGLGVYLRRLAIKATTLLFGKYKKKNKIIIKKKETRQMNIFFPIFLDILILIVSKSIHSICHIQLGQILFYTKLGLIEFRLILFFISLYCYYFWLLKYIYLRLFKLLERKNLKVLLSWIIIDINLGEFTVRY